MLRSSESIEDRRLLAVFLHEYQYGKALGGVERRFVELSKRFPESGIQVAAIEYDPSVAPTLSANYKSVLVTRHKPKTVLKEAIQLVRLSFLAIVWGRRLRCELVYSPSAIRSQVIPASAASFFLKKPLVVVFHSPPSVRVMKNLPSAFRSHLVEGEALRKSLIMALIDSLAVLAYRRASMCIAVSKATAERIQMSFSTRNLIITGNGVGEEWFETNWALKVYDACFLGRISPRKNVILLLLAWERVVRQLPDAKLIIIGGGEDPRYVRKCSQMITTLGLESNVTMSGFLDDDDIRRAFDSSKIFVMPSKREGFGLAVAEAMARGVPCVLTQLPSLQENFGDSALYVAESNPESWAHAILRLLDNENVMNQMSESGKRRARQFRWQEVARREAFAMRTLIEACQDQPRR